MPRRAQRGAALLEIVAALGVMGVILAGAVGWMDIATEDTRGQQAAAYQARFADAAGRLVTARFSAPTAGC